MGFFSSLIAILKAIPAIIDAINNLASFIKTNNLNNWLGDLSTTIDDLGKARTLEEKRDVAKRLSELTHRL